MSKRLQWDVLIIPLSGFSSFFLNEPKTKWSWSNKKFSPIQNDEHKRIYSNVDNSREAQQIKTLSGLRSIQCRIHTTHFLSTILSFSDLSLSKSTSSASDSRSNFRYFISLFCALLFHPSNDVLCSFSYFLSLSLSIRFHFFL